MTVEYARAMYDQRHDKLQFHDGTFPADLSQWSTVRDDAHPYHYKAGVRISGSLEDLNPHDHFLGGADRCPECSGDPDPDAAESDDAQQD